MVTLTATKKNKKEKKKGTGCYTGRSASISLRDFTTTRGKKKAKKPTQQKSKTVGIVSY
jgi:hypothetical protein